MHVGFYIHIEGIHFQNSILNLAEMIKSNCVNIRFFWHSMVLTMQWSISPMTVMKTPNSSYHEPFLSPYQLSGTDWVTRTPFLNCVKQAHSCECSDVCGFWFGWLGSVFWPFTVGKWAGVESLNAGTPRSCAAHSTNTLSFTGVRCLFKDTGFSGEANTSNLPGILHMIIIPVL
jgi:hypothetical protein